MKTNKPFSGLLLNASKKRLKSDDDFLAIKNRSYPAYGAFLRRLFSKPAFPQINEEELANRLTEFDIQYAGQLQGVMVAPADIDESCHELLVDLCRYGCLLVSPTVTLAESAEKRRKHYLDNNRRRVMRFYQIFSEMKQSEKDTFKDIKDFEDYFFQIKKDRLEDPYLTLELKSSNIRDLRKFLQEKQDFGSVKFICREYGIGTEKVEKSILTRGNKGAIEYHHSRAFYEISTNFFRGDLSIERASERKVRKAKEEFNAQLIEKFKKDNPEITDIDIILIPYASIGISREADKFSNYDCLGQLAELTEEKMYQRRGTYKKHITEIREVLESHGRPLGTKLPTAARELIKEIFKR